MHKLFTLALAVLLFAACGNQTNEKMNKSENEQKSLSARQKGLAACACLMAQGDALRLEPAIRQALNNGVTVNELKEAFSQLYAYTGFPRSLNALGVLAKVLEDPQPNWQEGRPWKRPAVWDDANEAYELGAKNQTQLSGQSFNYTFCPQDDYYLKAHLFGDIFAGDQLCAADREIVTVAALSGLTNVAPQLAAHKRGAVNMGNSQELVDELCAWLEAEHLTPNSPYRAIDLKSPWRKGQPNDAYAQYFTGRSYVSPYGSMTNVTFEPGCRNNWHVHHGAVQVLVCVYGRGWYQEWGKPAVELHEGVIIEIPEGVKHWHGAAANSWMQHLTYHKDVQEGASNEWLEPVTDEVYDLLK